VEVMQTVDGPSCIENQVSGRSRVDGKRPMNLGPLRCHATQVCGNFVYGHGLSPAATNRWMQSR